MGPLSTAYDVEPVLSPSLSDDSLRPATYRTKKDRIERHIPKWRQDQARKRRGTLFHITPSHVDREGGRYGRASCVPGPLA